MTFQTEAVFLPHGRTHRRGPPAAQRLSDDANRHEAGRREQSLVSTPPGRACARLHCVPARGRESTTSVRSSRCSLERWWTWWPTTNTGTRVSSRMRSSFLVGNVTSSRCTGSKRAHRTSIPAGSVPARMIVTIRSRGSRLRLGTKNFLSIIHTSDVRDDDVG